MHLPKTNVREQMSHDPDKLVLISVRNKRQLERCAAFVRQLARKPCQKWGIMTCVEAFTNPLNWCISCQARRLLKKGKE